MSRRAFELSFIGIFLFGHLVIAPLVVDLYPFSTFPMFSDKIRQANMTVVLGPGGERLDPVRFALGPNDLANPAPRQGVRPARSALRREGLLSEAQISDLVKEEFQRDSLAPAFVDVDQLTIGPIESDHKQSIGIVAELRTRVINAWHER
jgi:hypothetical protein